MVMSKKTNKPGKKTNWIAIVCFMIGIAMLAYPLAAQGYYRYLSSKKIVSFQKQAKKIPTAEVQKRLSLARAYNDSLLTKTSLSDPYTVKQKEGRLAYAKMLEVHEMIGTIKIPKINVNLAIYAGTSESVLQKGAGHLEGSSLPVGGKSTRAVITAHRGLPDARLFTDLNKMKVGDKFYITNLSRTLAYQVDKIQVITPKNVSAVKIEKGRDLVTLLTCTPYMINTHRLLVTGHRIPYHPKEAKKEEQDGQMKAWLKLALIILAFLALIALFIWWTKHRRGKKGKGQANQDDVKENKEN